MQGLKTAISTVQVAEWWSARGGRVVFLPGLTGTARGTILGKER